MEAYKQEFIEFMIDCNVLKFGDFVTKSGRKTPFFVNTGFYRTGAQLKRLGEYYAEAINAEFGLDFDVLFGPAYKGIPLTVATTMSIAEMYDEDIKYCSNRKEVKDHGDKGILLGSPIEDGDKVVIIEDVNSRNIYSGDTSYHQGTGRRGCHGSCGFSRQNGERPGREECADRDRGELRNQDNSYRNNGRGSGASLQQRV